MATDVDQTSESVLAEYKQEAVAGSAQRQLFLGKHYYNLSNAGTDPEENARIAVDWLTQASKQGDEEATSLLKTCLQENKGIDEGNRSTVEWCVNTSALEKNARIAASALFHKLNPLKQQALKKEEYLELIRGVTDSKSEQKLLEKAAKKATEEGITEEQFVERLVGRLKGKGGVTLKNIGTEDTTGERSESWSYKIFHKPVSMVMKAGDWMVEYAAKKGHTWILSLIPTNQIHMLLVFFVYSIFSFSILRCIPVIFFYISFLAMIVCTLQMFYNRQKLRDVRAMADILQRFNTALDSDTADSSYQWNSLTPYLTFFGSLFVALVTFGLSNKAWIPCSELVAVGLFATAACFVALSNEYDKLLLVSMICNFMASLPVFTQNMPQIPVVYHLVQLFCGSVISIEITPEMHINIGLPSMLYLIVPVIFLNMARGKSWEGTYRILVPHLVCLFWWQMTIVLYQNSTWFGLLRGTIGWILGVVLFPLLVILLFGYGLYLLATVLTFSGLLKMFTTVTLLAIPAFLTFWSKSGFNVRGMSLSSSTGKFILVALSVFTVVPMMWVASPQERDVGGNYMTWQQYQEFCSYPRWTKANMADAQIRCSHLRHMIVSWSGVIKKVTVKSIDNQAEGFVDRLPMQMANWLRCTYGRPYGNCEAVADATERIHCKISTQQGYQCHMKNLDHYTFDIWVSMKVDDHNDDDDDDKYHDVRLMAPHAFKDIAMTLKAGHKVTFRGALEDNLGNTWPELKLYHLECDSCPQLIKSVDEVAAMFDQDDSNLMRKAFMSFKEALYTTLNFFIAPVIQFGSVTAT